MGKVPDPLLRVYLHIGGWGALLTAAGGIAASIQLHDKQPGNGLMVAGGIMMGVSGSLALVDACMARRRAARAATTEDANG